MSQNIVRDPAEDSLQTIHQLLADYHEHDDDDSPEQAVASQQLRDYLNQLHYADIADLLETLPPDDRMLVWSLVNEDIDGRVLVEVSDPVRESLIEDLDPHELVQIAGQLDGDELADITPYLDDETVHDLVIALDDEAREQYEQARHYPDDEIGSLMDFDFIRVREDITCSVVLRYLRRFDALPSQTDKIFVIDEHHKLIGTLLIRTLLVNEPQTLVRDIMLTDSIHFHAQDDVEDVANAFERYDLVTAAVVDDDGHLIGRVTIEQMVDVLRAASDDDIRQMAGIHEDEDLFSSPWQAFRTRWLWLVINLCTAFLASRVIGMFEESIAKVVALAALMPIVAGLGGNTGNQTITLIVRAMHNMTLSASQIRYLYLKEIGVALMNGIIWGSVLGLIAWQMYDHVTLGLVMALAMLLNQLLAAIMAVSIPVIMQRLGRDPALGSSVLITACTDSGGFFIFLGLASLMLH
ncbi:MAG: magnesium transporter [Cardiobacteriaceae bacterium]|nr:magnesium transporter [Cardiobacteriaceae bacterium]